MHPSKLRFLTLMTENIPLAAADCNSCIFC